MDDETVTQDAKSRELPTSAKKARRLGCKRYFTGKPCKEGHIAERLTSGGHCLVCHRKQTHEDKQKNPEREREYRKRNSEKMTRQSREWARENRERSNAIKKKYRDAHKQELLESNNEWRRRNPERQRENQRCQYQNNPEPRREATRLNKLNNRAYCTAKEVERYANKKNATPAWADRDAICAVYERAQQMTEQNGEAYNVDHIVPLQSDIVCGLHVEENLQVITRLDNVRKGNRWWPNMPGG